MQSYSSYIRLVQTLKQTHEPTHGAVYVKIPNCSCNASYFTKLISSIALFYSASFFFYFILSFTSLLYRRIFIDGTASLSPKLLQIFSTVPSYFFPARSSLFWHLAITAVSAMVDNLFSGIFPSFLRYFNFLASLIVFKMVHYEFYSWYCSARRTWADTAVSSSCCHLHICLLFSKLHVPFPYFSCIILPLHNHIYQNTYSLF